jgi:HAD superfamily hydrolase (TIGR01490 family)
MRLALFDFDGTLTTRDSLMPFLRHVVGTPRFVAGLAATSLPLLSYALGSTANDVAKQRVLAHFLRGRDLAEIESAGRAFARDHLPGLLRPATLAALQTHRAAGDTCVLVSASLDVYLQPWADQHGFAAVLCSRLEVDTQQQVTGRIQPANCYGPEKARRIHEWLAGRQPSHITAWGDSRGDAEMFALADTVHQVRG